MVILETKWNTLVFVSCFYYYGDTREQMEHIGKYIIQDICILWASLRLRVRGQRAVPLGAPLLVRRCVRDSVPARASLRRVSYSVAVAVMAARTVAILLG